MREIKAYELPFITGSGINDSAETPHQKDDGGGIPVVVISATRAQVAQAREEHERNMTLLKISTAIISTTSGLATSSGCTLGFILATKQPNPAGAKVCKEVGGAVATYVGVKVYSAGERYFNRH